MTTTLSFGSTNRHIAALKSAIHRATTPIQWLVVAHNDPRLASSLQSALAGKSAAVLHVSQDTWDFQSEEFVEAFQWGLDQSEIRNLLLVGSSQAEGGASRASLVAPKKSPHVDSGFGKLLSGAQRHNLRSREAQARFAGHVQRIGELPAIAARRREGGLVLHAIYYRAEDGIFFDYDIDSETFRPLWS